MSLNETEFKDRALRVLGAVLDYVDGKDVSFMAYEPRLNPIASLLARTMVHALHAAGAPFEARYSETLADHRRGTKLVLVAVLTNAEDFDEVNLERLAEGVIKHTHDGDDDFRTLFVNCHYTRVPTTVDLFKTVTAHFMHEQFALNRVGDSACSPTA